MKRILDAPDRFLETEAEILKPGRSSTVGRKDGLVLKRYNLRKFESLAKDLFRSSRARRAYRNAYHLELLGIPTPRPLAAADRRCCGFLLRSYFLMEAIPGATHLGALLRLKPAPERDLIRQAAGLIAKLHEEGFSHGDLKETNLVLDNNGRMFVLDLDGLRFLLDWAEDQAAADLVRLAMAMAKYPCVSTPHRFLFLRVYCRARRLKRVPRLRL